VLAEQGAEVLHVSSPQRPDPIHTVIDTGFGKRCAFVDLDLPADVAALDGLIRGADVFAHSWRPGSLDRRGLSPAALAAKRPGIIYVSVSCYGYDGPWAERAGYDPLGQVASGYAAGEGSTDEPVMVSAYMAAAGVNAAVLRRAREGGSYHVKTSLTAASMYVLQLGRLPREHWSDGGKGVAALPQPHPEHMTETRTPFGVIEHPLPIAQYSATPSYWALPPEPAGASELGWRS
jgi:crotonobetainyl-CoA:carnitine CoA-transferase CaiB-like acyl-CoA transferase